ncbi:MAG TPA: redoxin domain-containing protein [Thermoanaerobaculia bacterium]
MNKTVLIIGVVIVAVIVFVLFGGLGKDPQHIDSPLIGKPAPPFALKAVGTGETIDLESLRGKPVIVNFWATWCVPCYEEHPTLVANARNLPNVQFVGVVFNDTEYKIQRFLA